MQRNKTTYYNPFYTFSRKMYEAKEDEANKPDAATPEQPQPEVQPNEPEEAITDLDKVLIKSGKVKYCLTKLFTSQDEPNSQAVKEIKELISDIKCISYRPTTFKIVIKNGSSCDLIYDPSPLKLKNADKLKPIEFFRLRILGKVYDLSKVSDYQQAVDNVSIILRENPINSENPNIQAGQEGEAPSEPASEEPKA